MGIPLFQEHHRQTGTLTQLENLRRYDAVSREF